MADKSLKAFLKDWYRVHHFHMMPPAIRDQLKKLQDEDSETVTAETQATFRDYIREKVQANIDSNKNLDKTITVQEVNIDEIRTNFSDEVNAIYPDHPENLKAGDKINITLTDANKENYLRVMSPKIGDKFYFNSVLGGAERGFMDKKTGDIADAKYPEISEMDEDEIRRFYTIVRTTLRNIKDSPPEFPNPDAPPVVDDFIGEGKAFKEFQLSDKNKKQVEDILRRFADAMGADDVMIIQFGATARGFSDKYPVSAFLADLKISPIRARALAMVPYMLQAVGDMTNPYSSSLNPDKKAKLDNIIGGNEEFLARAVNQESETIDDVKLAMFKDKRVWSLLLASMYDSSKEDRKSAFAKDFEAHDGDQIIKPMDAVVGYFKYDKLNGTYKDKLTGWQGLKKWFDDGIEGHWTKLLKKSLRHNYLDLGAKSIVGAITKLEISPEKGLKEILAKKDDIKKILEQKGGIGIRGFDFLVEVLGKINTSGDMKKTFEGALKNGYQAEALAKEIIKAALAAQPTKINEAKAALETLAVMRYDTFSSVRGHEVSKAINETDFLKGVTIKSEPIKFILNVAQRGVKLGANAAVWLGIMGRNAIQQSRGKISDEDANGLVGVMDKIKKNSEVATTVEQAKAELDKAEEEWNKEKEIYERNRVEARIKAKEDELEELNKEKDEYDQTEQTKKKASFYRGIYENIQANIASDGAPRNADNEDIVNSLQNWTPTSDRVKRIKAKKLSIAKRAKREGLHNTDAQAEHRVELSKDTTKAYAAFMKTYQFQDADFSTKWNDFITYVQKNSEIKNQKSVDKDKLQRKINFRLAILKSDRKRAEIYHDAEAKYNIAKDYYDSIRNKRTDIAEQSTPSNPRALKLKETEDGILLSYFWNAANGYVSGLHIDDYNILKAHKNELQTMAYNRLAAEHLRGINLAA